MLNKRLLIASAKKKEQRKVKLNIGFSSSEYAWGYSKFGVGSLDVLPYWGARDIRVYSFVYGGRGPMATTVFYLEDDSVKVTAYVEGYKKSIASGYISKDDLYNMEGSEGEVRYLTFDPPDGVLGSRDTRTNLEYYVEEVPWEAQDAEQGPSDDEYKQRWCTHRADQLVLDKYARRHRCVQEHSICEIFATSIQYKQQTHRIVIRSKYWGHHRVKAQSCKNLQRRFEWVTENKHKYIPSNCPKLQYAITGRNKRLGGTKEALYA